MWVAFCSVALGLTWPQGDFQANAFKWFDSLGCNEYLSRDLIKIDVKGGEGEPYTLYHGFLIDSDTQGFRAFLPNLHITRFDYKAKSKLGWEAAEYSFTKIDVTELKPLLNQEDYRLPPWCLIFARTAALRGKPDLANKIFAKVFSAYGGFEGDERMSQLKAIIGRDAGVPVGEAVTNLAISSTELEQLLTTFIKRFPDNFYAKAANNTAKELRKLIAATKARPYRSLDTLSKDERIAELIYQLPVVNAQQQGSKDIVSFQYADAPNPAIELEKIGYEAIPALIQAMSDTRPTRSAGRIFPVPTESFGIPAGLVAYHVIEQISGKRFDVSGSWEEAWPQMQENVKKWYASFQKTGELPALMASINEGNDVKTQASRVIEKYPKEAVFLLVDAIRKAKVSTSSAEIFEALTNLRDPSIKAVALEVAKKTKDPMLTATAAQTLAVYDFTAAIPFLVKAFKSMKAYDRDDLYEYFLGTKHPKLLATILETTKDAQGRGEFLMNLVTGGMWFGQEPPEASVEEVTAFDKALEAALIPFLDDDRTWRGNSFMAGGISFSGGSVGDLTALVLKNRFPAKYIYESNEGPLFRRAMRVKAKNVWRKANGQPLLPVPPVPRVAKLPESVVRPLIAAVVAAPTLANQLALEKAGLGAFSAIVQEWRPDSRSKANKALESVAVNITNTVREVTVLGPVPPQARAIFAKLIGKRLTVEMILTAMAEWERAVPKTIHEYTVVFGRYPDVPGTEIAISTPIKSTRVARSGWNCIFSQEYGPTYIASKNRLFNDSELLREVVREMKESLPRGPDECSILTFKVSRGTR